MYRNKKAEDGLITTLRETKRALAAAKKNVVVDLISLTNSLSTIDSRYIPEILDLVCLKLDFYNGGLDNGWEISSDKYETLPGKANLKSLDSRCYMIEVYDSIMLALNYGLGTIMHQIAKDGAIQKAIYRNWRILTKLLIRYYNLQDAKSDWTELDSKRTVICEIIIAAHQGPADYDRAMSLGESDIIGLFSRLWLLVSPDEPANPTLADAFYLSLQDTTFKFAPDMNGLQIFLENHLENIFHFIRVTCARLKTMMRYRPLIIKGINIHSLILNIICGHPAVPKADHALKKEMFVLLTKVAKLFSRHPNKEVGYGDTALHASNRLVSDSRKIIQAEGSKYLNFALRYGVLETMVNLGPYSESLSLEERTTTAAVLLLHATYLTSISTIDTTLRALDNISPSSFRNKTAYLNWDPLNQWFIFSTILLERMVLKKIFEQHDYQSICNTCFKSPKTSISCKLYACSRCKDVMYCSRRCQARDWKQRHRNFCTVNVLLNEDARIVREELPRKSQDTGTTRPTIIKEEPKLTKRERRFLRALATRDARRCFNMFEAHARRINYTGHCPKFGFGIDYTIYPTAISTFPMAEAGSKWRGSSQPLCEGLREAERFGPVNGKEMIPTIKIKYYGGEFYTTPMLVRSSSLDELRKSPGATGRKPLSGSLFCYADKERDQSNNPLHDEIDDIIELLMTSVLREVEKSGKWYEHSWKLVSDELDAQDIEWPI